MSNKQTLLNIIKVSVSNIIKLTGGVFVGFLLPKIIGITDYGFYKTFTLYASYLGIFSFGFVEGIYLKYGGIDYKEINRESFRLYTRLFILLEFFIGIIVCSISLCFLRSDIRTVFIFISIFLFFNNVIIYYQNVSQITCRFKELSLRNIIQSILTIGGVVALYVLDKFSEINVNYSLYLIIYVSTIGTMSLWYFITYRDISLGPCANFNSQKSDLLYFFKIGFPLLIASICSTLILSLDRQFVNVLFDTDTYAVYAFAYNMLSLITTALAAISTVIYPIMKKSSLDSLIRKYDKMVSIIVLISGFCLIVYFPLQWFVPWFLPKYSSSLLIFRIILPGLALQSAINLIMHNYYKIIGKEFMFFIKCVVILILSAIANLVAYLLFKTTASISIASIVVMTIWYLLIEEFFVRKYKTRWIQNFVYICIISAGFYAVTIISVWWIGMFIYLCFFIFVTCLIYWKKLKEFFYILKAKNVHPS